MKRTASQTFTPTHSSYDSHLDAVTEDSTSSSGYAPSQHSHTGSLSRASQAVKGSCKQICRRFSTSSQTSRRPSLQAFLDSPLPAATSSRKPTATDMIQQRLQLQHQDSAVDSPTESALHNNLHSRFSIKRLASLRQRRPATSGPSGDYPRYNPAPIPVPAGYPAVAPPPGQAARAAAAAANIERLTIQRREEETRMFLHGLSHSEDLSKDVMKDSESGVGMSCSSPVESTEDAVEKKLGMYTLDVGKRSRQVLTHLQNRPYQLLACRDHYHDFIESRCIISCGG